MVVKLPVYLKRRVFIMLLLSLVAVKEIITNTFANRVDPSKMTRNEPSYPDVDCLTFYFRILTDSGLPIFKDGKNPPQKLRDERVQDK